MARTRRSGTRVPVSPGVEGKPSVSPGVRLLDEQNFREFRRRWREIDRLWAPLSADPEHWDAVAGLRRAAREELREEFRTVQNIGPAYFLIAI